MSSILAPRPDDRPPPHEDWSTGVTISIIAHASLIGALVWGLHWRSSPEVVASSAELWSVVPEAAAPPPVETPPPPPVVQAPPPPAVETPKPPDIVTEKIEEKKKPPPKPTPPPPAPPPPKPTPAPPPPKDKLDAKALAKQHEENVKRMLAQMNAPVSATGTAARDSGPSASYAGRIAARIRPNIHFSESGPGLSADVLIKLLQDGTITKATVVKSSGNAAFDEAALRGVQLTGQVPRDTDGRVPPEIVIGVTP